MTVFEFGRWLHEHDTSLSEMKEEYDAYIKRLVDENPRSCGKMTPFSMYLTQYLWGKHPASVIRACFPFAESKRGADFWYALDKKWRKYCYKEPKE